MSTSTPTTSAASSPKCRRVLILGSGKRVRETALPAFLQLPESFEIARICARTAKTIEAAGRSFEVLPFADCTAADLLSIDLVYVAVGKSSVPEVLQRLLELGAARCELLIDTPVLLFKHFRYVKLLDRFARAWVAEDCTELPWIDPVREAIARGEIGELVSATFAHSAYAYHANATLKRLFGSPIVKARRVKTKERTAKGELVTRREFWFENGLKAVVLDPRDYATGWFVIEGTKGVIGDAVTAQAGIEPLFVALDGRRLLEVAPLIEASTCVGFRVGDSVVHLGASETTLMTVSQPRASITAHMDSIKRLGFLTLLRNIVTRRDGYGVIEGLDDMVITYWLDRVGWWGATPVTSTKSRLHQRLFSLFSRLMTVR